MHRISIPKGARAVLLNLRYENHEAYVVGGCVRDSLLGKEPKDWDICTSATPDEVKELMHRHGIKTMLHPLWKQSATVSKTVWITILKTCKEQRSLSVWKMRLIVSVMRSKRLMMRKDISSLR